MEPQGGNVCPKLVLFHQREKGNVGFCYTAAYVGPSDILYVVIDDFGCGSVTY